MTDQLSADRYDAVLFDPDGVVTDTAAPHARAWKTMFDGYPPRRAGDVDEPFVPFAIERDYKTHVDGRPGHDGLRSFLRSRRIELPEGDPDDLSDRETACGLGYRKTDLVNRLLDEEGVTVYAGSLRLLLQLRDRGVRLAVVSSGRNCAAVLGAAGLLDLFEARVDGVVADERGLPGEPAPATFLAAAEDLGARPERTVVVEDAISGVAARRNGGFGLAVGVDRGGDPEALHDHGADLVVSDLSELAS